MFVFEVMGDFSSPLSSLTFPASRPKQFLTQRDEQTTPPAQSTSTQTPQQSDLNKGEAAVKLGPHGKPDPKYILSQLFRMMEEDAAAARKAKVVEEECKSFFFEPKTGAVPAPHHDTDSI
jgi:hypothetical protein